MAFVQKAIARINEPEKLDTLLKDLGRKHYSYGAKVKYVDVSNNEVFNSSKWIKLLFEGYKHETIDVGLSR